MDVSPPGWNNCHDGSPYAAGWCLCRKCGEWRHPSPAFVKHYLQQHSTLGLANEDLLLIQAQDGRMICPVCGKPPRWGPNNRRALVTPGGNYPARPAPLRLT
jgi:hypothetical protein